MNNSINVAIAAISFLFCVSAAAKFPELPPEKSSVDRLDLGTSLSIFGNVTSENMKEAKDAGFVWIEVTIPKPMIFASRQELESRFLKQKALIDKAGLKIWSCHLPYGKVLDISQLDDAARKKAVQGEINVIRAASVLHPHRLVLHPSSEPIADSVREKRIANCIASVDVIRVVADSVGAILCIENLPRTCLGRTSDEILRITGPYEDVGVTFDTNHLLLEDQLHFVQAVGCKIKHIHVSDYDKTDERHWVPGQGITDWGPLYNAVLTIGYHGPWMSEATVDKASSTEAKAARCTVWQVSKGYEMTLRAASEALGKK